VKGSRFVRDNAPSRERGIGKKEESTINTSKHNKTNGRRASVPIGCRDFNQFSLKAKQLILTTRGDKITTVPGAPDCFIQNLGKNLGLSSTIKQTAELIAEIKPILGTYEDYLHVISSEVISKYHQGTHNHMVQVYWFLCLLHKLIKEEGPEALSDYGTEERRVLQHLAYKLPEERWQKVELAGIVHDVCKSAFFLDFWLETGAFNASQISLVPFHTSLFIPLAEMLEVDPEVTALSVLHHYVIKEYPGTDIVSLFDSLMLDDTFCFMVEAINYADNYSALRAKRPEYRPEGVESFSHDDSMAMIREIAHGKNIGTWIINCIEKLYGSGSLDNVFPEETRIYA